MARSPLDEIRENARGCQDCPLWANATQTVFGAGDPHARVMLVGEQPGDEEDKKGLPFVGPAGRLELLQETLSELRRNSKFAAQLFYCRLFTHRPRLRRLLGGAPDFDGTRLLSVMGTAVAALKNPERFVGLLTLFARPGVRESLRDVDCLSAVDDALQWMLKHHLNGQFTAEVRSEEHTSELQSPTNLVCRLLLEKK